MRLRTFVATGSGGGPDVWANTAGTQEIMTAALAEHAPEIDARVAAAAVLGGLTAALLDLGCPRR